MDLNINIYDSLSISDPFDRIIGKLVMINDVGVTVNEYKAQTFRALFSGTILTSTVQIQRYASPTGSCYMKIYTATGTYGVDSVPDTLLATSDAIDVSTIPTSYTELVFTYSGVNKINLTSGNVYGAVIYYPGAVGLNYLFAGANLSETTLVGNYCFSIDGASWFVDSEYDLLFKVYGQPTLVATSVMEISQSVENINISEDKSVSTPASYFISIYDGSCSFLVTNNSSYTDTVTFNGNIQSIASGNSYTWFFSGYSNSWGYDTLHGYDVTDVIVDGKNWEFTLTDDGFDGVEASGSSNETINGILIGENINLDLNFNINVHEDINISDSQPTCAIPILEFCGILSSANSNAGAYQGAISAENNFAVAFVLTNATTLNSLKAWIFRNNVVGNMNAKIYNITGTVGVNALPTGSALAISDNFDSTPLKGSTPAIIPSFFTFSGANRINLVPGSYAVSIEAAGAQWGWDGTNNSATGYVAYNSGGAWAGWTNRFRYDLYGNEPTDTLNISESLTIIPFLVINVFDSIQISETVTLNNNQLGDVNLYDTLNISENFTKERIYDISVYDHVSIFESFLHYGTCLPGFTSKDFFTGLVAQYRMNDYASNSVVQDNSVNAYNGFWSNGNTIDFSIPGRIDKALAFDGATEYVQIEEYGNFDASTFSVAFWISSSAADYVPSRIITNKLYSTDTDGFEIALSSTTTNGLFISGSDPVPGEVICTNWKSTGWNHIAVVFSGITAVVYCNGIPKGATVTSGINQSYLPLFLGQLPSGGSATLTVVNNSIYENPLLFNSVSYLIAPGETHVFSFTGMTYTFSYEAIPGDLPNSFRLDNDETDGVSHIISFYDDPDFAYVIYAIGSRLYTSGSYFWSGAMDDFRIYNKALTSADALALYNGGLGTEEYLICLSTPLTISKNDSVQISTDKTVLIPFLEDLSFGEDFLITDISTIGEPSYPVDNIDIFAINESVSIDNPILGDISIIDNIQISADEFIAPQPAFRVFSDLNISEEITLENSQLGDISSMDGLNISEFSFVDSPATTQEASDNIELSESVQVEIPFLGDVSIGDDMYIVESIEYYLFNSIEVFDSITFDDYGIGNINLVDITDPYEELILIEIITITLSLTGINKIDSITINDVTQVSLSSPLAINIVNNINISETNTLLNPLTSIRITESLINISEYILRSLGFGTISKVDNIRITENKTINLLFSDLNLVDSINISDVNLVLKGQTAGLYDLLSITDIPILSNPNLGDINVYDELEISEDLSMTGPGYYLNVSDTLEITEIYPVDLTLGELLFIENIEISEGLWVEKINNITVEDNLQITTNITLESFRFSPSPANSQPISKGRTFQPVGKEGIGSFKGPIGRAGWDS